MSDLLNILEKYKARSGDEQNFMDKHTENVQVTDAPGGEKGKEASDKMKKADRKSKRQGYEAGEDEEMYEARQLKDPKKEMMVSKKGKVEVIDKKDWSKYEKMGYVVAEEIELTEESLFQIIDESIEELAEELTAEEYEILREMVETPESYKELIDSIMLEAKHDDDDDEDEDEEQVDEEDDEEEGLTDKQKKLPPALRKAVAKKAMKEEKDEDDDDDESEDDDEEVVEKNPKVKKPLKEWSAFIGKDK